MNGSQTFLMRCSDTRTDADGVGFGVPRSHAWAGNHRDKRGRHDRNPFGPMVAED